MTWCTYDWVYLCSSPQRLSLTLRYLSKQPYKGLRRMHICWCSHLDPAERPEALKLVAHHDAPDWLQYCVTDISSLATSCPSSLRTYFQNDKPRWALGVKLLLPRMFTPPFLYTDDDVLMVTDPQRLMENSFGTSGNFKFFKGVRRLAPLALELEGLLSPITQTHDGAKAMANYDERILDAGVFFMRYADDWFHMLNRFAALPYLAGLDPTSHEFRRIDQRFLTIFGLAHGWDRLYRAPDRRNCYSHPTKFTLSTLVQGTVFVHYKTGRHKADWMEALQQQLMKDGR